MAAEFMLNADPRTDAGKAASRRLRRAGRVPAVLYGGTQGAQALSLDHNELLQNLKSEAFRSRVLTVKFGGASAQAIVKDLQAHPFKSEVLHVDLQRVDAAQKIRMEVPLHFKGGDVAPGIKAGGVLSRSVVEVEIECLPKDLPEHLELDVSALEIGDALHLSDIPLPAGVALVALAHDDAHEHDVPVAAVHLPRVSAEEEEAEAQAAAAEGAEAAPAAEAKAGEEPARKEPAKKGESAA